MKQITVNTPISELKGVGDTRKKALARMNIFTARDLLYCFPRSYEHRGDIRKLGQGIDSVPHAYLLKAETVARTVKTRNGMLLTTFRASDDTGSAEIVFFNQPYVADQITQGEQYRFWGELKFKSGKLILSSPKFDAFHFGTPLPDYVPVYPLTESLSSKLMEKLVKETLQQALPTLDDFLPEYIRLKYNLPVLSKAMYDVHQPQDEQSLSSAIRRLMFDDFFCFALGVARSKTEHENVKTLPCKSTSIKPLMDLLPYSLTNAQKRCIDEIYGDMTQTDDEHLCPSMRRVLVGDVGSGKTICAAAAVYLALSNGHQAAMMVPTEILAYQHYTDLSPLFEKLGYKVWLLTGSTSQKEKKEIYTSLLCDTDKRTDFVIGTHALLSQRVEFSDLILTVTDEQHRFGILQRAALKEKSNNSHLLVMSATPIPRTLALTMYGDLAVSHIDEMPAGRQRVSTYKVDSSYRDRLYGFIRQQVSLGGQVYIVCPSIESRDDESDGTEDGTVPMENLFSAVKEPPPKLMNAVDYLRELEQNVFPDLRVSLIHGQMKASEKDDIMKRFTYGEIDILVSTTVIEVGVNVPNATVMVVENAERFGLSQLHQLRGRVGRGTRKSYCILVSDSKSETAVLLILQTLCECYDGYLIAERDLSMRGPGDFFASAEDHTVRQSGGLALKMGKYCQDTSLMKTAFEAAAELIKADPQLQAPENAALLCEVSRIFMLDEVTVS